MMTMTFAENLNATPLFFPLLIKPRTIFGLKGAVKTKIK